MVKFLNLSIALQKLKKYKVNMKKILMILFLVFAPVTACSTLSEINEKAKGDGVPYIPGI